MFLSERIAVVITMLLLTSLCDSTVALAASGSNFVVEPDGYRLSDYDDRVPDTIAHCGCRMWDTVLYLKQLNCILSGT